VCVDSNVFLYAKMTDRVFGRPCATVLKSVASGETKAAISTLVPLEVANAMRRYGLASGAADEIRAIFSLSLEVYPLEGADTRKAADVLEQSGVRPYDCAHAVAMRRSGLKEIVSADKDFDKFVWLKRIDPRSFAAQR
jgi:predicted nucleic acid-binding protein